MHQPMVDVAAWTLFTPPEPSPRSHIIVLAYPQSGADRLWSLLAGHPALACTAGTELIPLCDQAARTWRTAEAAGSTLSTLAAASVRAMAGSLITIIKSRAGRERWCEISTAPAQSVRTFLQLYPDTRVICLHRDCADFISSATDGCTRGPSGPAFGAFAAAHPGNPVAAAAACWRDRTEQLLVLERAKAGQCHRVRYEDLRSSPAEEERVLGFLGLRPEPGGLPAGPDDRSLEAGGSSGLSLGHNRLSLGISNGGIGGLSRRGDGLSPDGNRLSPDGDGLRPVAGGRPGPAGGRAATRSGVPPLQQAALARRIPPPLLEQVNRLHAELGYAPVGHVSAERSPGT
jgi:hypothetical protein